MLAGGKLAYCRRCDERFRLPPVHIATDKEAPGATTIAAVPPPGIEVQHRAPLVPASAASTGGAPLLCVRVRHEPHRALKAGTAVLTLGATGITAWCVAMMQSAPSASGLFLCLAAWYGAVTVLAWTTLIIQKHTWRVVTVTEEALEVVRQSRRRTDRIGSVPLAEIRDVVVYRHHDRFRSQAFVLAVTRVELPGLDVLPGLSEEQAAYVAGLVGESIRCVAAHAHAVE